MISNALLCPHCYTQNRQESVFCGNCGLKLPKNTPDYLNVSNDLARSLYDKKLQLHSEIAKLDIICKNLNVEKIQIENDISQIKPFLEQEIDKLDKLQIETAIHDLGFYKPRYDFESSEIYRLRLNNVREEQKELLRTKKAAVCLAKWTVNNSLAQGRKQTNDTLKLMLFAFNGEADVIIAKVKFNNVIEAENRIIKSCDLINKLVSTQQAYITQEYLNLKLKELYLSHEYQEKIADSKVIYRTFRLD